MESSDTSSSSDDSDNDNDIEDHGNSDNNLTSSTTSSSSSSIKSAITSSLSIEERIAPSILSQMSIHGTFLKWFDKIQWKNSRNKRECHFICTVLDVLIEENEVGEDSLALELLLRRLNGIHLADTTGNWEACSALQGTGPDHSLLSRDIVFKAIKQAAKMDKLTGKSSSKSSTRSSYESGKRYYGQNNKQYFGKKYTGSSSYPSSSSTSTSASSSRETGKYNHSNEQRGTSGTTGSTSRQ
jgi:hypothetical protein